MQAPRLAIRRYEQLLALEVGALTSISDLLRATAGDRATQGTLGNAPRARTAATADADVDDLIDHACSTAGMSGADWDRLTEYLGSHPALRLHPTTRWTDLADRLLLEMTISTGVRWIMRYEAMNRLLMHPVAGIHAVASCANLATDPNSQVFTEVVSVLDATSIPDAARHVVRQLAHPTNTAALYGAVHACVRKTRYIHSHFTAVQQRTLSGLILDLLDYPGFEETATVAANLARAARRREDSRLERSLNQAVASQRIASDTFELNMTASARRIWNGVSTDLAPNVPRFDDVLLPGLIETMLSGTDFDPRLNAAFLLAASPYRAAIGNGLHNELRLFRGIGSTVRILDSLQVLGSQPHRHLVELLAASPHTNGELRSHAVAALAHMGGSSDDQVWQNALGATPVDQTAALTKIVYGLGVNNKHRLLDKIHRDRQLPAVVRTAARWWMALPSHISTSALT